VKRERKREKDKDEENNSTAGRNVYTHGLDVLSVL
jgi:hypothetical protein